LFADKTRLTGWGAEAAAYHPQYSRFRGYVLLEGDARHMPWTTTKTGVDEDSRVFRTVQNEMFDSLQKVQAPSLPSSCETVLSGELLNL
jgi:hypothetical protein